MEYNSQRDVVIFGARGNVGSELVRQLLEKERGRTNITGVVSSGDFLYKPEGLSPGELESFSKGELRGKKYDFSTEGHEEILYGVQARQGEYTSFVDATASPKITDTHKRIVENKFMKGLVTANKNPLIGDIKTFRELTANPDRYQFACSVMAGAGAIAEVDKAYRLGDQISEINGCFSGTLAYLCNELMSGNKFSNSLQKAVQNNFTEPDPRDDLNGFDVARKILTLARKAGRNVNLSDIVVEPFLPKDAFRDGESVGDFMQRCGRGEYDSVMSDLVKSYQENGQVLQYLAKMRIPSIKELTSGTSGFISAGERSTLNVGLVGVDKNSILGNLQGTDNGFSIYTKDRYPNGLFITAPGAGLEVTAGNARDGLNFLR